MTRSCSGWYVFAASEPRSAERDGGAPARRAPEGCWVQVSHITQGDTRQSSHRRYSVGGWPDFVACDAGLELCDRTFRCDCTPRPRPRPFVAIEVDGGESTGNVVPRRKP